MFLFGTFFYTMDSDKRMKCLPEAPNNITLAAVIMEHDSQHVESA